MRPTSCDINLDNVAHNVRTLAGHVAPTPLCVVVKANGYGHGAVPVARAAVDAGALWLGVALVEEGVELRNAGIDVPILVLSEQHADSVEALVGNRLVASVYSSEGIAQLGRAAAQFGAAEVQLVVDSGMRRVGIEVEDLDQCVSQIEASSNLELTGVWTHCPVADEPGNPFTDAQLARFDSWVGVDGLRFRTHVANSAVALTRPSRPALMVRCGISAYGIDPDPALAGIVPLRPALTLRSAVSFVKRVRSGESVGYGHRWTAPNDTTLATVPIGYADGVRRDLGLRGGVVLIGGERRRIVGVITMDQLVVDVGAAHVGVGDDVVLIGSQGDASITAADIAATLDTIPYEVVCAIGARVPRRYA
ncbi:MAG: alanine racemase [Verrucomicrobiales bacterium]|jgi:alanine racemase